MELYRYQRISSGSKQIGKGISMRWSGNNINLTANLEVSGAAATAAIATGIGETIRKIWNASFDENYRVVATVDVLFRSSGSASDSRSQIEVTTDGSATNVSTFPTLFYASMNYHLNNVTVIDWTPAHEFGHMLGLDDHYDESTWSRIRDVFGYSRTATIQPGWDGNIMAVHRGTLQKRNLQELFAIHATELVTCVEDAATEFVGGLERGIRGLYGIPW